MQTYELNGYVVIRAVDRTMAMAALEALDTAISDLCAGAGIDVAFHSDDGGLRDCTEEYES